jgi:hypothetical protein
MIIENYSSPLYSGRDLWTGASTRGGDLSPSLVGWAGSNRAGVAAWTLHATFGPSTLSDLDADRMDGDRLFTTFIAFRAELSTMLLRLRPVGRCAASSITSEMVLGRVRGFDAQLPF